MDSVSVVQCKDCEYFVYLEDIMTPNGILLVGRCELTAYRHPDDWYCADAEKRERYASNDGYEDGIEEKEQ